MYFFASCRVPRGAPTIISIHHNYNGVNSRRVRFRQRGYFQLTQRRRKSSRTLKTSCREVNRNVLGRLSHWQCLSIGEQLYARNVAAVQQGRQAAEILRVGAGGGWWWGDSESVISRAVKIAVVIQEDSTGRCKFMRQSVPVISDESPDFETPTGTPSLTSSDLLMPDAR